MTTHTSKIAKVTKRGGNTGFICTGCQQWHMFGGYVAAHIHTLLIHTCGCGQKHEVLDYVVTPVEGKQP